jgi:hypothetical protein
MYSYAFWRKEIVICVFEMVVMLLLLIENYI